MPLYIFRHPISGDTIEVVQRMKEEHIFIDEDGVSWERVFTKPQSSMDTKIEANSSEEFVKKTRGKNYSLGELWDKSAELSDKRSGMSGKDEVKNKSEQAYVEKTGKPHPHAKKQSKFLV